MATELRVVQINLQHSKVASAELELPLLGDVGLIQEPYITCCRPRCLDRNKGYALAKKGRPRAAIYIHKMREAWLVEEFTKEDLCVCAIKVEGCTWYIVSSYLDINYDIRNNDGLGRLIDHCERGSVPLVIGMDCNAHSSLWDSVDVNKRGEELEELIMEKDLTVANCGEACTFETARAKTIVDITITNVHAEVRGRVRMEGG